MAKTKIKDVELRLAEAQFIGFHHGARGYSIKELADDMGLTKAEWTILRESILLLSDAEKEEWILYLRKTNVKFKQYV